MAEIIEEGTRDGVLTTHYPDQAARVILSSLEDLGYATTDLLLAGDRSPDVLPHLERIAAATADALERVLGAPAGAFQRTWREELEPWLVPLAEQKEEQA
jgi:hypothetical protein